MAYESRKWRDWVCVQPVKLARLPAWLVGTVKTARRCAVEETQLPVALVQGPEADDALIVMRASDFLAWFGPLPEGTEVQQELCRNEPQPV